jgi:hypothetical protein
VLVVAAAQSVMAAIEQRGSATTATTSRRTLNIDRPDGVEEGDVLIVCIAKSGNSTTDPSSEGWTLIDGTDLGGLLGGRHGAVLYKVAGSSEGSRYSFALGSGTSRAVGGMVAFSGVATDSTPFDVAPGDISVQASQRDVVATAITTATDNAAVIMLGMAAGDDPSWSAWDTVSPGALTELYDRRGGSSTSVGAAWAIKVTAGNTGEGTARLSTAERNGAILIALRPASTVVGTTTTLNSSGSPSSYGTAVTFTATVTPNTVVNGTRVDFYDGATLLGSGTISGSSTKTASFTAGETQFPAGSHSGIVATFVGDATFASSTSAPLTQTVTPLEITGAFAAQNKIYDGDNAAVVLARTLTGLLEADQADVELTGGTATFDDAQVGDGKTVTLTGASLDGPASANYSLASVDTTQADISARELTVSGAVVVPKVYDGTTDAAISGATLDGVIGTDDVTLANATSGAFADKNVGLGKPVASGMTLAGTDGSNYSLVQPALTGDITPAALTIAADNKVRFLGTANPTLTASYSGFSSGETAGVLTTPVSLVTPADISSPPGVYPITASGAVAPNYSINYVDGNLAVVAAPHLTEVARQGNQFMFTFPTLAGQEYLLENTDELSTPSWAPLGDPVVGTGLSMTVTNAITWPHRYFRIQATLTDWPAGNDGRLEVPGGTNAITFVTVSRHPHMEIRTAFGAATNIVWHWGDGSFSTNSLLADHDFGVAGVHTNYVEVLPREALSYFGAPRQAPGQGISGVYGLANFPNLNYLYLYRESVTDLSLAGCSNLVQLHLGANPVSVETCDQWFIDLDNAVTGPVTGADFWYPAAARSSASDTAWTNLVSKGYIMHPL